MIHGGRTEANGRIATGLVPARGGAPVAPDGAALIGQVEAVVRSVLAEMFRRADEPAPDGAPPEGLFAGRLLGLRDAERLAEGAREIQIVPGTVVTPMAGDFLRRRGVAIRWTSHGELVRAGALGEWGFAVAESAGPAVALRRALLEQEREAWREVGTDGRAAADWVAAAANRGAVVVTPRAAVATWRACRVPGVRAAAAADPDAVLRACRDLGANLLVIDPIGQSIHALKMLCTAFRRAGVPQVPDGLDDDNRAGGGRP